MGHCISALIGKVPIDKNKAAQYDLPFFEKNGFVIVALDPSHADFWDEKLGYGYEKVSEILMDTKCTHFLAKEIGLTEFAIIHTEYFGGVGEQFAASYQSETQTLAPSEDGINKALKRIGVKRNLLKDEFDTIGLGEYRNWDGLFEKYEDL
jgi:hypothetical protein